MTRPSDPEAEHPAGAASGDDESGLKGRAVGSKPIRKPQQPLRVRLSAFTDRVELSQATLHPMLPVRRLRDHIERDPALNLRVRLSGSSQRVRLRSSSGSTVRLDEGKLERIVFERVILEKLKTTLHKVVSVARIEARLVALNPSLLRAWLEFIRDASSLTQVRWLTAETITAPPWIALEQPGPRISERRFGHDRAELFTTSQTLAMRFWRGHCATRAGLADLERLEPDGALRSEITQWFSATDANHRMGAELPDGVICTQQGYEHRLEAGLYWLRSPIGTVSASPQPGIPPHVMALLEISPHEAGEVGLEILRRRARRGA